MNNMNTWQEELQEAISSSEALQRHLPCDSQAIDAVIARYPLRIPPYYLHLIQKVGGPLWRQAVPDIQELNDPVGMEDPLDEEARSPVPNLVHKYPDRALLLVSSQCAMYCRFCTRKRKVGQVGMRIREEDFAESIRYLQEHPSIREVLLSGGDPLLLRDAHLEEILQQLKSVKHLEFIRIGTRVPCTLPMRITPALVAMLRRYHPLYINTHFNHPAEVSPAAAAACTLLADAGIPLGCQTVLLRGVNDSPEVMAELFYALLRIRVKPYYLMQADLTKGTAHFRTDIRTGLALMQQLQGRVSGMALPSYVLDAPGGHGKIPLSPDYLLSLGEEQAHFLSYQGIPCSYPLV